MNNNNRNIYLDSKKGFVYKSSQSEIENLQKSLQEYHYIQIENFLAPATLNSLEKIIQNGTWSRLEHKDLNAYEYTLKPINTAFYAKLSLLFLNKSFEQFLKDLLNTESSCFKFKARIFSLAAGDNRGISWHDDSKGKDRVLGISLNLSKRNFLGGHFKLRYKHNPEIEIDVPKSDYGSATFFNIIPDKIEHCVERVEGSEDRIVMLIWVYKSPHST